MSIINILQQKIYIFIKKGGGISVFKIQFKNSSKKSDKIFNFMRYLTLI